MNKKLEALVIDDDSQVRHFVSTVLRDDGWSVSEASTAEEAFAIFHQQQWSLVFCDVRLGGENGFAVLRRFVEEQPKAQFILMTGHGSAAGALDATAFGAYDYLLKPFSVDAVLALSHSAREKIKSHHARARVSHKAGNEENSAAYISDIDLTGRSAAFLEVMKLVGRVSLTNLPILITGESGTGKEVVARAIHRRSRRASKPFVGVNCGALPADLIESELFGHVRGSFTGADKDRPGLLEEADGGTVLLDEITETTHAFQVKLLRALQEGEIRRVGSNSTKKVDVRVIAASNQNVETAVKEGRFRQDLLYRLNAVSIHLPPLRERREDIRLLAERFAQRLNESGENHITFSPEAIELLENYSWPGNIRELENAVERAAALCDHVVRPGDLPELILNRFGAAGTGVEQPCNDASFALGSNLPTFDEWEKILAARVMAHTKGNIQAAARILAVDRKTVERMIKRHQINLEAL